MAKQIGKFGNYLVIRRDTETGIDTYHGPMHSRFSSKHEHADNLYRLKPGDILTVQTWSKASSEHKRMAAAGSVAPAISKPVLESGASVMHKCLIFVTLVFDQWDRETQSYPATTFLRSCFLPFVPQIGMNFKTGDVTSPQVKHVIYDFAEETLVVTCERHIFLSNEARLKAVDQYIAASWEVVK